MTAGWFDVDRFGLAARTAEWDWWWIIREMAQNCLDEKGVKFIHFILAHVGHGLCRLVVEDDAPNGFADLRLAYTMFAPTPKRKRPDASGVNTIGEKLVLANCKEARITTTTGSVIFNADGTRTTGRKRTASGSVFDGLVKMPKSAIPECRDFAFRLLPPRGVTITFNGEEIPYRKPKKVIKNVKLQTLFERDGELRRTQRNTNVEVYEPLNGETPTLYELGLPVQETEDRWHYLIRQRVPVSMDRNHVSPKYLRTVRVAVLNAMNKEIQKSDVSNSWVRDAASDDQVDVRVVKKIARMRFGDKALSVGPGTNDRSKDEAITRGYHLIGSREMSKDEWRQMRRAEAVQSADSKFPVRAGYGDIDWTSPEINDDHKRVAQLAEFVGRETLSLDVTVGWTRDRSDRAAATYQRSSNYILFNLARLPRRWFKKNNFKNQLKLIIHEIAHHGGWHYERGYHECLEGIGVELALIRPSAFKKWRSA